MTVLWEWHDMYPTGAVVEILFDVQQLERTIVNLNRTHISIQDILKELNARLSTVRPHVHWIIIAMLIIYNYRLSVFSTVM